MLRAYRESFRPSPRVPAPHTIVVVSGFVSEDEEKLASMRGTQSEYLKGLSGVAAHHVNVFDVPTAAAQRLGDLATDVGADEVMFLGSFVGDALEDSYSLLAHAWRRVHGRNGAKAKKPRRKEPSRAESA
jgi:hypothetical protein